MLILKFLFLLKRIRIGLQQGFGTACFIKLQMTSFVY